VTKQSADIAVMSISCRSRPAVIQY